MGAKIGTLTGYDRSRMAVASAVVVLAIAAVLLPDVLAQPDPLASQLLMQQDIWLAPLFVAFCFLQFGPAESSPAKVVANETRVVVLCLVALLLVCWAGHYLAFANYEISRDEQLVAFDAEIFRRGALVWPIAPDWQHLANALNRKFMLPISARDPSTTTHFACILNLVICRYWIFGIRSAKLGSTPRTRTRTPRDAFSRRSARTAES